MSLDVWIVCGILAAQINGCSGRHVVGYLWLAFSAAVLLFAVMRG